METLSIPTAAPVAVKPWIRRFVRIGYAAKGVIYILIGVLALRLALGEGGRLTDQNGVLLSLIRQPFGSVLLMLIGLGLLAYAGWEIVGAALDGRRSRGWGDRALSIIKGATYGAIGVQAVRLVLGGYRTANNPDDYARAAMRLPLGEILLALIGAGIALYGALQMWKAWNSEFDDDLDQHRLRREGGAWVLNIGRAGIGARGLILVLVGMAFVDAALDRQPSAAKGTPEALAAVFSQPYGPALLAAVAAGLTCFGVFQLLHARYARV
jgi:hypothetical protein